jgi:hypothetical protein
LSVCYFIRLLAVEEVSPAVADLTALVAGLNATNNFAAFVKAMRLKFKSMCQ